MSEQSFEELLNQEESVRIHTNAIVTGKVIDVKDNEIVLNIGYKSDGIVTKVEYSNDQTVDLKSAVNVGDELEVKVLKLNDGNGLVALSHRRIAADKAREELKAAVEEKQILTGKVERAVRAGLTVDCQGAQVFIPASLVSEGFESNLEKFVGQEIEFRIIEYTPAKRRIIGDRKSLIAERRKAALDELLGRIQEGMVITGKVKNLTDFGAFIDLGGADGLLHISEMSWGRIDNPKKLYKVGDEVEAYIKEIKDTKIALSVRYPENNPWIEDGPYAVGKTVKGTVARMTSYGAFVELEPGIDGLLHVSQLAYERVEKPQDVLKIGQELELMVTEFDPAEHKISLSLKALLPAPEKEAAEEEAAEEKKEEEAPAFSYTPDLQAVDVDPTE